MSTLQPLRNKVLFQFEDELGNAQGVKQFKEMTNWGFQLGSSFDHNTKTPRWVNVIAVGPEVSDDISVGARVLVEPLKWTPGMTFEDSQYWVTTEPHVLAIDDKGKA